MGDVKHTIAALLPLVRQNQNGKHLEGAVTHYKKARKALDDLASDRSLTGKTDPQYVASLVNEFATEGALTISARRLIGTAIGAVIGAVLLNWLGSSILSFGLGLVLCGVACTAIGRAVGKWSNYVDRAAYRYAGIALAVVLLIPHRQAIWKIALDRFVEVSIGILVALVFTKIWRGDAESREDSGSATTTNR